METVFNAIITIAALCVAIGFVFMVGAVFVEILEQWSKEDDQ